MAETLLRFEPYKAKKGEAYMNPKQRAHFRKSLEDWKAALSQDIDATRHSMQDEQTVFADPNDRATQESDMALELRNRDRERKLTATLCIDCKTLEEIRERQIAK